MVVKEEVAKWFSKLHANKRIELVCTLLNMCNPFELRFFGTCIEELGKRDFNELRDTEHKANTCSEVEKICDLSSPIMRRKLLLYLALLHSSNYACSRIFYQILSQERHMEQPDLERLDELLVLYTMALNHPAFTVEQKNGLTEPYDKLVQFETLFECLHSHTYQFCEQNSAKTSHVNNVSEAFHSSELPDHYENQETSEGSEPNSCSSSQCSHSSSLATVSSEESPSPEVYINQLELKSAQRCRDRKYEYLARVSWSNGDSNNVMFTQTQIYDFHHKLIELFAAEAGAPRSERCLPYLHLSRESNDSSEEAVRTYLQQLAERCPMHIRLHPHVVNFFKQTGGPLEIVTPAPSVPSSQVLKHGSSTESSDASRFSTQSLMEALTSSPPPPFNVKVLNKYPPGFTKPPTSLAPAAPQRPSSYVKGNENDSRRSKPTSRDGQLLQDLLKSEHLHKYWETLHKHSLNELKTMTDEEFRKKGLSNGAVGKLKKVLHNMPNGLTLPPDQKKVQVSSMVASPIIVSGANTVQLFQSPPPVYPTPFNMRLVRPPFQACFSPTFLPGVTPPARFPRDSPEVQDGGGGGGVKSNGSSPSCSEYSSPPGSPHLHSDTSTSNDDLEHKDAALLRKQNEVPLIKKSHRERGPGSTSPEERSPLPASRPRGTLVMSALPPPTSWPRPLIRAPYNVHPVESVIKEEPKDHPVPSYPPPQNETPSSPPPTPPYPPIHNFLIPGGPPLMGGFPGMIPTTNGFLSMPPGIGFAPNGLSPEVMYGNGAHFSVVGPPQQGTQSQPTTPGHFLFQPPSYFVSHMTQAKVSCYNCGGSGHRGNECKEPTFDDVTKTGYRINYNPSPKPEKAADL